MTRFFLATVLGGRLHPNDIPDWGPWDSSRLHWWPEDHLDKILNTTGERKVRTTEELEAALAVAKQSDGRSRRVRPRG